MDSELELLLNSAKSNLNNNGTNSNNLSNEKDGFSSLVRSIPKLQTTIQPNKEQIFESDRSSQTPGSSLKSIPLRNAKPEKPDTAGKEWFDIGKPDMTPELRRDLQLLKMRHVLDPKRFYKKESTPLKYFAVGTIKEDPTEFFSNRLTRKQRKSTLAEEVLSTRHDYFKSKYKDIQRSKTSGRRKHQKKQRDMRA